MIKPDGPREGVRACIQRSPGYYATKRIRLAVAEKVTG